MSTLLSLGPTCIFWHLKPKSGHSGSRHCLLLGFPKYIAQRSDAQCQRKPWISSRTIPSVEFFSQVTIFTIRWHIPSQPCRLLPRAAQRLKSYHEWVILPPAATQPSLKPTLKAAHSQGVPLASQFLESYNVYLHKRFLTHLEGKVGHLQPATGSLWKQAHSESFAHQGLYPVPSSYSETLSLSSTPGS